MTTEHDTTPNENSSTAKTVPLGDVEKTFDPITAVPISCVPAVYDEPALMTATRRRSYRQCLCSLFSALKRDIERLAICYIFLVLFFLFSIIYSFSSKGQDTGRQLSLLLVDDHY
ncbi:hypothetical protein CDAR_471451 [Caerostris darwini]|uniref:Uncharacterized protein n=1 Tax=Caerostris darwini TaxID=1538125 RepID=A0AAV4RJW9_9ARAC|nr:hypothetical protein CDAR_471451 [Caerostris darwini]